MIRRRYRCPSCQRVFEYDHHPSVEADPVSACPYTGCDAAAGSMAPALVMPHIAKSIGRNTDAYYREMEAGAAFRAQMAQETHGLTTEEASAIKITDMRDNLKEGEIAAPPVSATPGGLGFIDGGPIAAGLQQSVFAGHHVNAGLDAMMKLRQGHALTAASRVAAGTEPGNSRVFANTTMTTELPANETQAPGYRRRR
jgi:hypothetical protein